MTTFPFWRRPCRGCFMGWPYRKWQRYDGYGRCFVHYGGHVGTIDEQTIICSNMNWFQRHPYLTALPAALAMLIAALVWSAHT